MTIAPRWTPRWWHWLLFVLIFLLLTIFTILFALRTAGRADYQHVLGDLHAKGAITTIDEFIARAPVVEASLQEDWYRWSQRGVEYPPSSTFQKLKADFWLTYRYGDAPLPPEVIQAISDHRHTMQSARDLLQDRRLLVSTYGHLAQDLPPGKRTLPYTSALRVPNLLSTRSLATWLRHAACTESDPRTALDDLDRFHHALSRPACLIDAMIWTAVAAIRNDTYLDLMLLGRLPETNRVAWLAEDCHLVDGVALGIDAERILFNGGWVQMGDDANFLESFWALRIDMLWGSPPRGPLQEWLRLRWFYTGPWAWATIHHDAAVTVEHQALLAARIRGETTAPIPDWLDIRPRYRGYGAFLAGNLIESAITALEAEARHRAVRIAVMLLADLPSQRLPDDPGALEQRLSDTHWLSPTGDRLHLAYERLADDRFRLGVSPTSPVPNFDAPGRLTARTKAFGTPPDKRVLVTHPHLEIQLPARLAPTP